MKLVNDSLHGLVFAPSSIEVLVPPLFSPSRIVGDVVCCLHPLEAIEHVCDEVVERDNGSGRGGLQVRKCRVSFTFNFSEFLGG